MSAGLTARHGADNVRKLQSALYRTSKPDKAPRVSRLYDKGWRTDVRWEAWRHVKAKKGAPGVDGKAIAAMVETGQAEAMRTKLQAALREKRYPFAPVRLVESPTPKGGTRPLGSATVEDRVVPTAMKLVLEPLFEADVHDCADGYRPKRDAKQASMARRDDLDNRAWGVVESACQSYFNSMPHRTRVKLMRRRIADGSLLKLIKQTLRVGVKDPGQGAPPTVGVPQGAPLSPLSSNIYLNLREQLWQRRGYAEKLGATLPRYADDAILACRSSPPPGLAALEAIATRRALTSNREKTAVTRVTDGGDFIGFNVVQRKSPSSGKHTIDIFPAKSAHQKIRSRRKYLTSRRAPMRPQECVGMVNPLVTGGVTDCRHTNASQAFRGLQRFVNRRVRR